MRNSAVSGGGKYKVQNTKHKIQDTKFIGALSITSRGNLDEKNPKVGEKKT